MEITDKEFETIIAEVLDELPEQYTANLNNVAIVYEDEPDEVQREALKLRGNQTLYGLYQGIPLTKRGAGYNLVLPDKITIFKKPILYSSRTPEELKAKVKHTVWHELAHHYGLEHGHIHAIENRQEKA